jgi:hypothetical protein
LLWYCNTNYKNKSEISNKEYLTRKSYTEVSDSRYECVKMNLWEIGCEFMDWISSGYRQVVSFCDDSVEPFGFIRMELLCIICS